MSFFVTRLWMPVPSTSEISIVCSCAIFRTSGDERWRMRSSIDSTRAPVGAATEAGAGAGAAALEAAGAGGGGATGAGAGAGGSGFGLFPGLSDDPDDRVDRDRGALLDLDLDERACHG